MQVRNPTTGRYVGNPTTKYSCKQCSTLIYAHPSQRGKTYCSTKCYGLAYRGRTPWNKGKGRPKPAKKPPGSQIGNTNGFQKGAAPWNKGIKYDAVGGEKNVNWKGGVTPINEKIRRLPEYKQWRKHVFQRDDYTCQACGERGGQLHADHELPFANYPALRIEILNGRTLCKLCHSKINTRNTHWNIPQLV